ncbi:unnamed protein product [Didymodactylos carnosus]|uniref:Uncharacterized protein n=1 Tax=Didymodactylos carnosus TaxID=1234261 RepID=A0A8S2CYG3_9BILA|nr:unnamed protein product [Didymodactylos carnosus]CAF3578697.1 unnamed protein product [Didymodactylos carnosus]
MCINQIASRIGPQFDGPNVSSSGASLLVPIVTLSDKSNKRLLIITSKKVPIGAHLLHNQNRQPNNPSQTSNSFKRQLTNMSLSGDNSENRLSNDNKKLRTDETGRDDFSVGDRTGRSQRGGYLLNFNQNQLCGEQEKIQISNQALKFAMDNHFPPIKIVCTSKLQKEDGAGFVKSLVQHIEKYFNVQNLFFKRPLAFEAWWGDMSGDVSLLTK